MNKTEKKDSIIMGIDYGSSFIGTALGRGENVVTLSMISGKNAETAVAQIAREAIENKVSYFVIGLPLSADNKETKQSLETRQFAKLLKVRTRMPVKFYNEYESTAESLKEAIELGVGKKKRRHNDSISAALILTHYLQELS